MENLKFYNKGIAKQNPLKNINVFANNYQENGNPDAPMMPLNDVQFIEICDLLKSLIREANFLAFAGEQKALIKHILECLNEDLPSYLSTIQKAALSTNDADWIKMVAIIKEAYNEY